MGRPSKYHTHVEPHLKEIEQMARDMTEKEIAKALGVSERAFRDMKSKYPPLSAVLKKGKIQLVRDLKETLIRKAKGFTYTEKKTIIENGVIVREEIYTKSSLPDVAALNLLLKNYDRDNWANDPQMLKLKEKELELREKQVDATVW